MVKVKEKGWSGPFIRVKSDWIWPLYLAVPLCDLLLWAPDIGVLRAGGDQQSHSHYFKIGFLFRVTFEFQGNSLKNKSVTDCCEEAKSLLKCELVMCCIILILELKYLGIINNWEVPWALQGQWHGVKDWGLHAPHTFLPWNHCFLSSGNFKGLQS